MALQHELAADKAKINELEGELDALLDHIQQALTQEAMEKAELQQSLSAESAKTAQLETQLKAADERAMNADGDSDLRSNAAELLLQHMQDELNDHMQEEERNEINHGNEISELKQALKLKNEALAIKEEKVIEMSLMLQNNDKKLETMATEAAAHADLEAKHLKQLNQERRKLDLSKEQIDECNADALFEQNDHQVLLEVQACYCTVSLLAATAHTPHDWQTISVLHLATPTSSQCLYHNTFCPGSSSGSSFTEEPTTES